MAGIPIVAIAIAGTIILILAFAASRYKVAKPNEALIIAGSKRSPGGVRVVVGGGAIVFPLINVAKKISLEVRSIEVGLSGAVTKQGVPVAVNGIVNVKIADNEDAIRQAAQRFLDSQGGISDVVRNVMEGSLRTIVGQLSVEELIQDREMFAQRVQEVASGDLQGTGLVLDVFTIQSISDSESYIENLGRKAAAEVKRDADIAEAETIRQAREKQEEAQQAILQAQKTTQLQTQAIAREVATEQAKAEAAKPLADAEAKKAVVLQETEVAELNAAKTDRELDSSVRKQADANRYAAEQNAEAAKFTRVAEAEANKTAVKYAAEATAFEERETGLAQADATRATGEAEADAMSKKAAAYKEYDEAAILELLVSRLPEIAREIASPLGNINDLTVVDTNATSKVAGMTGDIAAQLLPFVKSLTGVDLSEFLQRKTGQDSGKPGYASSPRAEG